MSQLVPYLNYGSDEFMLMEDSDFFMSAESVWSKKMVKPSPNLLYEGLTKGFMTYEGLHSGVPTRTTQTVTPTTLKNIEQTFIELQRTEHHENEAGFVPPMVHNIGNNQYIPVSEAADMYNLKSSSQNSTMWHSSLSQSSLSDCDTRSTPPLSISGGYEGNSSGGQTTRRNMGGRKPAKDINLSPEEEERRKIRRERNKAAAARCRKRRVDHTNQLIMETEDLERKRQNIQDEIQRLKDQQDELNYILTQHKQSGKCQKHQQHLDIKPFQSIYGRQQQQQQAQQHHHQPMYQDSEDRVKAEPMETLNTPTTNMMFILPSAAKKSMLSAPISKPSRPNSLNVGVTAPQCITDMAGIPISTPSSGMHFNFDSLMGGGTGLTPVSAPLAPSCSTQQRNIPISSADMSSPDACNPPKLVSL